MNNIENNLNIIRKLRVYLKDNPEIRFTQALFNLGINEFSEQTKSYIQNPHIYEECPEFSLADKYNEPSEVTLNKIKNNGKIQSKTN